MKSELIHELAELPADYWWLKGKHELGFDALDRAGCDVHDSILDIGCGGGQWAEGLKHRGFTGVTVVDGSMVALVRARQRGLRAICARVENLPFRKNTFNVVTAMDILEHVDNDSALLLEIHRVLSPSGHLLVHVPAHPFLFSYWDRLHGHFRRYTYAGLKQLMTQSRFKLLYFSYAHAAIFFPAVLVRAWKSGARDNAADSTKSDFMPVGNLLNQFLSWLYRVEIFLSHNLGVPVGLSLITIAEKKENA